MSKGETPQQVAEAAAIRRRWITLGELLAVAAVIISGLTFWNSYQERSRAEADRVEEKQAKSAKAQIVTLAAIVDGRNLRLSARDPEKAIQEQTIAFPSALGVNPINTVDPRIEARWIEAAVSKARGVKAQAGDPRLPVLITTRFLSGGESHSSAALYDVGYRIDKGLLDSDVDLVGLSLIERISGRNAPARLDALWRKRAGG